MLSHADKLVLFCVFYQRGSPVGCRRALLREGYPNNSSVAIMAGWPEWAPGRFLCTEAELQMPSYPHCITGNGFPQENPTDVFPISFYLDWWRSCIASPWTPLTLYHNLSSAPVAPEISLTVCKTDPAGRGRSICSGDDELDQRGLHVSSFSSFVKPVWTHGDLGQGLSFLGGVHLCSGWHNKANNFIWGC